MQRAFPETRQHGRARGSHRRDGGAVRRARRSRESSARKPGRTTPRTRANPRIDGTPRGSGASPWTRSSRKRCARCSRRILQRTRADGPAARTTQRATRRIAFPWVGSRVRSRTRTTRTRFPWRTSCAIRILIRTRTVRIPIRTRKRSVRAPRSARDAATRLSPLAFAAISRTNPRSRAPRSPTRSSWSRCSSCTAWTTPKTSPGNARFAR